MAILSCKTRGNSTPQGKPSVYFTGTPEDFDLYFEEISNLILEKQNCAIWYCKAENQVWNEEYRIQLAEMQLFVIPVTSRLLTGDNFALRQDFAFALAHHIPVLPLMEETGLDELFSQKMGALQYLSPVTEDPTALPFEDKLEKFLEEVLVGEQLSAQIRSAFDAYVFLSYRKKDRKYAQELMRLIHQNDFCRDIAIWYDEFLTPGENFNDSIADALRKSKLFTLVVTPNLYNETNYVMTTEYPMACEAGKTIMSAELLPIDRDALHQAYRGLAEPTPAHDEIALSETLLNAVHAAAIRENDKNPVHNFFIGLAYLGGVDVEVDHDRALALIQGAAEQDLPEAKEKLVSMYSHGDGVPQNHSEAAAWLQNLADYYQNAYRASQLPEDRKKLVETELRLSQTLCTIGESFDARHILERSEAGRLAKDAAASDEQFFFLAASWYEAMENLLQHEGEWWNLEKICHQHLELCEKKRKIQPSDAVRRKLLRALIASAELSEQCGKRRETLDFYEKARQAADLLSDPSRIIWEIDSRLGQFFLREGEPEKAIDCLTKSLQSLEPLYAETRLSTFRRQMGLILSDLFAACLQTGEIDRADAALRQSGCIFDDLLREENTVQSRLDAASQYTNEAALYCARHDFLNAQKSVQRAIRLGKEQQDAFGTAAAALNLAESHSAAGAIAWECGQYRQAEQAARACLSLMSTAMKVINSPQFFSLYHDYQRRHACYLAALGKYDEAQQALFNMDCSKDYRNSADFNRKYVLNIAKKLELLAHQRRCEAVKHALADLQQGLASLSQWPVCRINTQTEAEGLLSEAFGWLAVFQEDEAEKSLKKAQLLLDTLPNQLPSRILQIKAWAVECQLKISVGEIPAAKGLLSRAADQLQLEFSQTGRTDLQYGLGVLLLRLSKLQHMTDETKAAETSLKNGRRLADQLAQWSPCYMHTQLQLEGVILESERNGWPETDQEEFLALLRSQMQAVTEEKQEIKEERCLLIMKSLCLAAESALENGCWAAADRFSKLVTALADIPKSQKNIPQMNVLVMTAWIQNAQASLTCAAPKTGYLKTLMEQLADDRTFMRKDPAILNVYCDGQYLLTRAGLTLGKLYALTGQQHEAALLLQKTADEAQALCQTHGSLNLAHIVTAAWEARIDLAEKEQRKETLENAFAAGEQICSRFQSDRIFSFLERTAEALSSQNPEKYFLLAAEYAEKAAACANRSTHLQRAADYRMKLYHILGDDRQRLLAIEDWLHCTHLDDAHAERCKNALELETGCARKAKDALREEAAFHQLIYLLRRCGNFGSAYQEAVKQLDKLYASRRTTKSNHYKSIL